MERKISDYTYFDSKFMKGDEFDNYDFDEDEIVIKYMNVDSLILNSIKDTDVTIRKFIDTYFNKNAITVQKIHKYTEKYFKFAIIKNEIENTDFDTSTSSNIKRIIYSLVKEPIINKELSKIMEDIFENYNFDEEQIVNIEVDSEIFYEVNELLSKSKSHKEIDFEFLAFPKEKLRGNTNIQLELVQDGVNFLDLKVNSKARFSSGLTILVKLSCLIQQITDKLGFIFNDNVRYYVKDNRVDNSIIQSLLENPYDFHILHNGISIVCNKCELIGDTITLDAAQIINGAQTIYNVVKVFKFGLMDEKAIENVCIMIKVLVIDEKSKNKITSRDISLAANTQKRIFQYDLSSNSSYSKSYFEYFQKNGVELLLKRGSKRGKDSIQIDKFVKVLLGCLNQVPHKARNESIEKYFDDDKLKYLFPIADYNKDFYFSIRLLIAKIYLEWISFKKKGQITPLTKYGEKMAISYAFYKVIQSENQKIIDREKFEFSQTHKDIVIECFEKLNKESEVNKWELNDFRNEFIYKKYVDNLEEVKDRFKKDFIPITTE